MSVTRWLEFRDSKILAVHGNPDRVCVELEGLIHQWEGAGAGRRGTGWSQQVRIEIDFPDVDQGISGLPAALRSGRVVVDSAPDGKGGGLKVPVTLECMIVLELVTRLGERLRVCGERLEMSVSGEPRFVAELSGDMDPERAAAVSHLN